MSCTHSYKLVGKNCIVYLTAVHSLLFINFCPQETQSYPNKKEVKYSNIYVRFM